MIDCVNNIYSASQFTTCILSCSINQTLIVLGKTCIQPNPHVLNFFAYSPVASILHIIILFCIKLHFVYFTLHHNLCILFYSAQNSNKIRWNYTKGDSLQSKQMGFYENKLTNGSLVQIFYNTVVIYAVWPYNI